MDALPANYISDSSDEEEEVAIENDLLMFRIFFGRTIHRSRNINQRQRSFNLDKLDESKCWSFFRFQKPHIRQLADLLLPEYITTPNRLRVHRVEAMCILLRRLAYPNRLLDLVSMFGRSKSGISHISNSTLSVIFDNHRRKLETLDQGWINPTGLSAAVHAKGSPLDKCMGFIDGTARPISRSSHNQREGYSGHKRVMHALKFQSVILPNGMIATMYGPMSGRRHDCALLHYSGLLGEMERHCDEFYLYGDQAYPIRRHLIVPYKGATLSEEQEAFNASMSGMRTCVEWGFGKIIELFSFLDFNKNQRLLRQPVGKYYLVGTLLTNCHTCLYGCQTASHFNCPPPSLQEYLL